jgi:WhiB family transcriptional regulator, redox-sensing transcriptional regulator
MTTIERLDRTSALYRLLTTLPGTDFGGHPACADKDPELFFPEPGQTAQIEQAKAVCTGCPVLASCLRFALRNPVTGVWGATTEDDRRALRATRLAHAYGLPTTATDDAASTDATQPGQEVA